MQIFRCACVCVCVCVCVCEYTMCIVPQTRRGLLIHGGGGGTLPWCRRTRADFRACPGGEHIAPIEAHTLSPHTWTACLLHNNKCNNTQNNITHTHTHTQIQTYTLTRTQTCTHTHKQTHTHTLASSTGAGGTPLARRASWSARPSSRWVWGGLGLGLG